MIKEMTNVPEENPNTKGLKREFFEAAVNLFASKGYENVSLNEIAEKVGKKAGNLNYYYRTKDELLAEIYQYYESKYSAAVFTLEEVVALIKETGDPYEAYRATNFYDLYLDPMAQKALLIIIAERNHDSRAEKLFARVFVKEAREHMSKVLKKLVELKIYEPFDVDMFVLLVNGYDYFAASRAAGKYAMSVKEWEDGHKFLFQAIKIVK
jgi:AcrR family transcriptional regulator